MIEEAKGCVGRRKREGRRGVGDSLDRMDVPSLPGLGLGGGAVRAVNSSTSLSFPPKPPTGAPT